MDQRKEVHLFVAEYLVEYGYAEEGKITNQTIVPQLKDLEVLTELSLGVFLDVQENQPYTVSEIVDIICHSLARNLKTIAV